MKQKLLFGSNGYLTTIFDDQKRCYSEVKEIQTKVYHSRISKKVMCHYLVYLCPGPLGWYGV